MTIQHIRKAVADYAHEQRFKLALAEVEVRTFTVRDLIVIRVDSFPDANGRQPSCAKTVSLAELHTELKNQTQKTLDDKIGDIIEELVADVTRTRQVALTPSHEEPSHGEVEGAE